ncbi:hypothetical protein KI387_011175, partial [Taxus chinensis]
GMVDVMSAMEMAEVVVISGIGPSYKMTGGKVDVGSTEPDGADVGVGMRVRGMDTGM